MLKLLKSKKFIVSIAILAGLWVLAYLGTLGYAAFSMKKKENETGEKADENQPEVSKPKLQSTDPKRFPLRRGSNDKKYDTTYVHQLQILIRNAQLHTKQAVNGKALISKDGIWGNDTEAGMELLRNVKLGGSYYYRHLIKYDSERGHSVESYSDYKLLTKLNNGLYDSSNRRIKTLTYGNAASSTGFIRDPEGGD